MSVWVGSAIDRSSFESPKEESSSDDSWVLFWSEERMVDFPEETVLPVVGRTWGISGEEDASSRLMACRRGELCSFFDEPIERLSVMSLRKVAVFVRCDPCVVSCFTSGDTGREGTLVDLPSAAAPGGRNTL